jgi:hypothetical protein
MTSAYKYKQNRTAEPEFRFSTSIIIQNVTPTRLAFWKTNRSTAIDNHTDKSDKIQYDAVMQKKKMSLDLYNPSTAIDIYFNYIR